MADEETIQEPEEEIVGGTAVTYLDALKAELAAVKRQGKDARVAAIEAEIKRVSKK